VVTIEIKLVYSGFLVMSLFERETEEFSDCRTKAMANNKSESQKSISIDADRACLIPAPPHTPNLLFFIQRFRMHLFHLPSYFIAFPSMRLYV
jgi:hypothetical protein